MRPSVPILLLTAALGACTAEHQPPALPDAKMVPDEPPRVVTQAPPAPEPLPTPMPPPVIMAPPPPPTIITKKGKGKAIALRQERPESVMAQANRAALVTPMRQGYFGDSAIQRYIYQPGKVYLIISSAVILRPYEPGMESTLPLLTQGGRAYFCRIRSQDSLGMVAVTWELPTVQIIGGEMPNKPKKLQAPAMRGPVISLERLHTGYNIEVVGKYRPAWMPQSVLDDGSKTVIRFQEPLGFTNAPAVFTLHPDTTPGIVEFSTYSNPEHPEQGLYYIVQGLWPELRLRGTDNQEVKIVRSVR